MFEQVEECIEKTDEFKLSHPHKKALILRQYLKLKMKYVLNGTWSKKELMDVYVNRRIFQTRLFIILLMNSVKKQDSNALFGENTAK